MISRRQFCKCLAAITAGSSIFDIASLASLAQAEEYFKVKELGPGQWVISEGGGSILLLANDGQPILIDAGVGSISTELLEKITGRVGAASCTLINTHHHPDHIGGNFAVRQGFEAEVIIYAHDKLKPRVAKTLDEGIRPGLIRMAEHFEDKDQRIAAAEALVSSDFEPTDTYTDELEIQVGVTKCLLQNFGPGHTDNDTIVFLPEQNILHMGDLIFHELHPYVIPEHNPDIAGWQKSLYQAHELCDQDTVVIPGHGEISDRTALKKMDEYFGQVTEVVAAAIKEGRTREEVAELKPAIHADRGLAEVQHMTLTKIFDELSAGN